MRTSASLRCVLLAASLVCPASGADITTELVLQAVGRTTSALVTPDPWDVYSILATNPNAGASTVELDLTGVTPTLLALGNRTFDISNRFLPFGFVAPDSFFIIPNRLTAANILAVGVVDNTSTLRASYTIAGGGVLIPGGGARTPIAELSVPAGARVTLPPVLGSAVVQGRLVRVAGSIPEPAGALLAASAAAFGLPRRR